MTKKTMISLAVLLTLGLFSGCSDKNAASPDQKAAHKAPVSYSLSLKRMKNHILAAGEEAGWKMTRFKENELLAEKFDDGEAQAVVIKFSGDHFTIESADSSEVDADDLREAIEDQLQKEE